MTAAVRLANIGLFSGFLAGLIVAVGGRVAMRVVAIADPSGMELDDVSTGVTGETLWIFIVVPISAVKGGLLFMLIRRWLPGSRLMTGLAFGLLVLVLLGIPLMLIDEAFSYGPPALTFTLFGALFVAYGVCVVFIVGWLEGALAPAGEGGIATFLALLPLALLGLLSIPLLVPFYH